MIPLLPRHAIFSAYFKLVGPNLHTKIRLPTIPTSMELLVVTGKSVALASSPVISGTHNHLSPLYIEKMSAAKAHEVLEKLDQKTFGFFHVKMIVVS